MSNALDVVELLGIISNEKPTHTAPINGLFAKLSPITFKQQKELVTIGLDGIVGVLGFIKKLNELLILNVELPEGKPELTLMDRVPFSIYMRKFLSEKPIGDVKIQDLVSNVSAYPYTEVVEANIDNSSYNIKLKVPTLREDNVFLSACINKFKTIDEEKLGDTLSLVLSYEIPKFIESISFNEKTIEFSKLQMQDKLNIVDRLPAEVASHISDFITTIRDRDEKLLTVGDVTVDLDSTFFE